MGVNQKYAIKVIWLDGQEEFVREGIAGGRISLYSNIKIAKAQRDFMLEGMEEDVQSINVVPYPLEKSSL